MDKTEIQKIIVQESISTLSILMEHQTKRPELFKIEEFEAVELMRSLHAEYIRKSPLATRVHSDLVREWEPVFWEKRRLRVYS